MKYKLKLLVITLFTALVTVLMVGGSAHAFTLNRNRIIDDGIFNNYNTMSPVAIDSFLNSFPGSCISANSGFRAVDPNGYSPSGGYRYGAHVTAGQVIYDAAYAYGLNPQVLLATLQKEEGLVRGDGPYGCSTLAISAALGYACPDSPNLYNWSGVDLYQRNGITYTSINGVCVNNASAVGFSQQVIRSAWLFKFSQQRSLGNVNWAVIKGGWDNSDDPQSCYGLRMTEGWRQTCPGGPTVYYDGLYSIDGSTVHMDTGATAALYNYTPHFHGNQSFVDIFTGWFGTVYSNDTDIPHPNGTLVSDGNTVYRILGNTRQPIANPAVFFSMGYQWSQVKVATTGDNNLPLGSTLDTLASGTLFTTGDGKVYVTDYFGGVLKKQWLSYDAFVGLGYNGSDVMSVPEAQAPASTQSGLFSSTRHPAGTLILASNDSGTYMVNQTTRSHVMNPTAFATNSFSWSKVKPSTTADLALSLDTPIDVGLGSVLWNRNNIYIVDYDVSGAKKRAVGPWECYANRWHYAPSDWVVTPDSALPARSDANFTC